MQKEIHTFAEWEYPFIAQDYEGYFNCHCPDNKLGGLVLFDNDTLEEIVQEVKNFIANDVPAIMVELCHINNSNLGNNVVKELGELFEAAGYIDLQSYEHRLAYGKAKE